MTFTELLQSVLIGLQGWLALIVMAFSDILARLFGL